MNDTRKVVKCVIKEDFLTCCARVAYGHGVCGARVAASWIERHFQNAPIRPREINLKSKKKVLVKK